MNCTVRLFAQGKKALIFFMLLLTIAISPIRAVENVIIVVIDGARYAETFGTGATYIPNMWNYMKPYGTVYNNFYNYGVTNTNPGHASIVTGTWQYIANDGSEHPTEPTIFEYYRKSTGKPENSCFVLAGTDKLNILQYSSHADYGSAYAAACTTNNYTGDLITWQNMLYVMDTYHPKLLLMNLKDVDMLGHEFGNPEYFTAITRADSIVYQLWLKIQSDSHYQNSTTLIVTCDHGMLYVEGDWYTHGDDSEDCQHLIFLAIGKNIPGNSVINTIRLQIDIAPTVGDLMGFSTPCADGTSLFSGDGSLPVTLSWFIAKQWKDNVILEWQTESETENLGFIIERQNHNQSREELASYINYPELSGQGNSSARHSYSFTDVHIKAGQSYSYRLADVNYHGIVNILDSVSIQTKAIQSDFHISGIISIFPNPTNSEIIIQYYLQSDQDVSIAVYDLSGRICKSLKNEVIQKSGEYSVFWDTRNKKGCKMPSGIYFVAFRSGLDISRQKLVLIR